MTTHVLSISRAIDALRRGDPILMEEPNHPPLLCYAIETLTPKTLRTLPSRSNTWRLTLSAARATYLKKQATQKRAKPTAISFAAPLTTKRLLALSGLDLNPSSISLSTQEQSTLLPATSTEIAALTLLALAERVPAILTTPSHNPDPSLPKVSKQAIQKYPAELLKNTHEICRTPLTLKNAKKAELLVFRADNIGTDHYALLIGNIHSKTTPLVRIHSSCYTGDLLNSLECDCHDQLHQAIGQMAEKGSGILLYLMQEGRGIGLTNKLRAYALKHQGADTVDANRLLGFEDDARDFACASRILKELNISKIALLSNNPRKGNSLKQWGITVTQTIPLKITTNPHNERYLKTKQTRLGHTL